MRVRAAAFALALALGFMTVACGGDEGGSSEGGSGGGGTVKLDGQSANDHGSEDASGKVELSLELDDFYFEPTVLMGVAGQQLTLELENEGDAEHNFSLPDGSIDQDVESGESATVTVTFPDSGTLVFFCKYHDGQGMRGALEVA